MKAARFVQTGCRLITVFLLSVLAALVINCGKKTRTPIPRPETTQQNPSRKELRDADLLYRAGSYDRAAELYRRLLELKDPPAEKDYLLFRLALSLTSAGTPPELAASRHYLETLLETYPTSRYVSETQMILHLVETMEQLVSRVEKQEGELQKLLDRLEKLKEIDLKKPPFDREPQP